MTGAAPRQQGRPQDRRAQQRDLGQMAFHGLPFLAAIIVPALLAWWAA